MGAILAYATQLLSLAPAIRTMTTEIRNLFGQGESSFKKMLAENRAPTDEEWEIANKLRDAVHAQIQAP